MSYAELVANARRDAIDAREQEQGRQLYVSQQAGYDGQKLVADSVRCGLMAIAGSARELLDDQYRSIALALLETTLLERWDKLAWGSKAVLEEPLCTYYCRKEQPRCIDPNSKFACPVYLITGSPNCANRPFYTRIKEVDFNEDGKWSLEIEYQTEFITRIIFALSPQKKSAQQYTLFNVGDIIKNIPFDELTPQPGVHLYNDGYLRHEEYREPSNGIYYNYDKHRVRKYVDDFYEAEYKIISISDVAIRARKTTDNPTALPYEIPIWSCYRVRFMGFYK